MIFDPIGNKIMMFGGRADRLFGMKYFNDLWSFNTATQTWTLVKTSNKPPARLSPGMVYDPVNHQIIVFGGHGTKNRLGDTWVYTISANRWEEITPEISPSARSDMGMEFDTANNRVILFSGYFLEESGYRKNDTWMYDPETQEWTEVSPQVSPPIMYGPSLSYDFSGRQSLLTGGHISIYRNGQYISGGYNTAVWSYSYSENTWQVEGSDNNADIAPPARYWQSAALNSTDGKLLVFGGNGGSGFLEDTWIYDVSSTNWEKLYTGQLPAPSPRVNGAVAYDPLNEVFVLFGGLGYDMTDFQDTWIFRQSVSGGEWIAAASKE